MFSKFGNLLQIHPIVLLRMCYVLLRNVLWVMLRFFLTIIYKFDYS